jgi:hypothetical protein
LKFALDKFSNTVWGFPVEIETDCIALKDTLLNQNLTAARARWREGILSYNISDVRHVPGKLNVVADGLSRKWEGQPHVPGDGSEWTVNDIMHVSETDLVAEALQIRFAKEPIFQEVVEAIYDLNHHEDLGKRKRTKHRASEYLVDEGKLWRLRHSNMSRAKSRVECVTKDEAKELARQTHSEGGHWGRDTIKLTL